MDDDEPVAHTVKTGLAEYDPEKARRDAARFRQEKHELFLDLMAKRYDVRDVELLASAIVDADLALDARWAKETSKLDRVATHLEKALALLNESAWATQKLPTGGFDGWTQGDLLYEESFDVVPEEFLWTLVQVSRAKHKEIQAVKKRSSPGKPHIAGAVRCLVGYWKDTLGRPAVGNHIHNRSFTHKRDNSNDASILQGTDDDSRVVNFVSDVMQVLNGNVVGVEHALDRVLPKK